MGLTPHSPNLLTLDNVSVRLGDTVVLDSLSWSFREGESWVLLGPNGAGKSTLLGLVRQQKPYFQGHIERAEAWQDASRLTLVSFDQQRTLVAREERKDRWEDYSGKEQHGLTAREFMDPQQRHASRLEALSEQLQFSALLDRPLRWFSNGEVRKTLLLRALLNDPALLILDEPFDGLDADSTLWLRQALSTLIQGGLPILLSRTAPRRSPRSSPTCSPCSADTSLLKVPGNRFCNRRRWRRFMHQPPKPRHPPQPLQSARVLLREPLRYSSET
jgi:molybdate transport system ATP-binding protein